MTASADHLLAIDAGTGSARAVIFDATGREVAMAAREYAHAPVPGVPGSQAFDTGGNWRLICACVREALAAAGLAAERIAAVSATSMREGMVLYDARGRELWACPNADARSSAEVTELVRDGRAREIFDIAGDWVAITAPPRLLWLARNEPELLRSTRHIGMLGDWILHRLAGVYVTDPSLGSSSGMFDLARAEWSGRVLELCGLDPAVVPEIVAPGTAIGGVTAQAAEETGLAAGTPVVVGGADTQLGLVGMGVVEPRRFTLLGGTFWQQTVVWDEPLIDPEARVRTLCHTVPGRWMTEGIGFYSGLVMRWFRDAFGGPDAAAAAAAGTTVYELLEREAAAVPPGSNGVFGLFSNVMDVKRWIHAPAGFVGLDVAGPEPSGRAACFRALEESAAYAARGHLEILRSLGDAEQPGEIVFAGGAAKGSLWPRIVADVLGVPVRLPAIKESTALGAAIYAGVGAGVFPSVEDAVARVVRFEETIEPDRDRHATYSDLYQRWRAIYARALELTEAGLAEPLWRAPGT